MLATVSNEDAPHLPDKGKIVTGLLITCVGVVNSSAEQGEGETSLRHNCPVKSSTCTRVPHIFNGQMAVSLVATKDCTTTNPRSG